MKNWFGTLLFGLSLFLFTPGCGPGKARNVAEDAGADKIAEYEAAVKADEDAANQDMEASEKASDAE